jgi:hypothetical protein
MSHLVAVALSLALAQGVEAASYRCGYYNGIYRCRRRRGLVAGAIAGIVIGSVFSSYNQRTNKQLSSLTTGATILVLLLLLCAIARRRRALRFRSPSAGAQAPGRQIGFMYIPTATERQHGLHHPINEPAMSEAGRAGHGPSTGPQFPTPQTQGAINHTRAGPYGNPIQDQAEGNLPMPPPAYGASKGETYRPVSCL